MLVRRFRRAGEISDKYWHLRFSVKRKPVDTTFFKAVRDRGGVKVQEGKKRNSLGHRTTPSSEKARTRRGIGKDQNSKIV